MTIYCDDDKHTWKEEYYGFRCETCDLFVPPDFFDQLPEHIDEEEAMYDPELMEDW